MNDETWSKPEKTVAKRAFDLAYERETGAIIEEAKKRAAALKEPADLWRLNDFLWEKRRLVDQKYDYSYSALVGILGVLVREGWLKREELAGLSAEKQERIRRIAEFTKGEAKESSDDGE